MKTFLNVVGALALLGFIPLFLWSQSAIHEIEACLALLLGCTCIGLAVVIEHQQEGHKLQREQGKVMVQILKQLETGGEVGSSAGPEMPPVPGKERYFISDGTRALGPHEREKVAGMLERGTITSETDVLKEGTRDWVKASTLFQKSS